MEIKKDILWRVYLCFLIMTLVGAMVLGRAFYIQNVEGRYWKGMGDSLHLRYSPILAQRGSIFTEDGNILSTSVPVFDIYVDFAAEGLREKNGVRFRENLDSLSIRLAALFGDKTSEEYKRALEQAYQEKDRYFLIQRKITFDQLAALRQFPLVRLGRNKSGFIFETRDRRINPYGLMANRTVGLSRKDSSKNVGLEKSYDSVLRGINGQRLMRYVAGTYLPVEGAEIDPINGRDLITTLDTYIQDVAEDELMNMLVDNHSLHGSVIVMETATGKIKAIANLGQQPDGTYGENLNYGIGKATEPGSVFKLVTLLSLLDDKYVTVDTKVDCEGGSKYFYGLRIKDSHLGYGNITVKEAFSRSSNVAFAKLANQYYQEQPMKWWGHLDKFRLNKATGVDVVATSGFPTIKRPDSKHWHKTTIPFMAHGYEELVTPLHMLMLYNAVANDGRMMKPYLVNAVREHGVDVKVFTPEVLVDKICSDEALEQARICLRSVVDSSFGTGHKKLFDSAYSISGKTGTAVTAINNQGYNKGNKIYQASFIGYFPSDKPQYTMSVVIQNSKESKLIYGADVSGTVFKKISDRIYYRFLSQTPNTARKGDTCFRQFMGMKQDLGTITRELGLAARDSDESHTWKQVKLKNDKAEISAAALQDSRSGVVPDVRGMGLKDAVYLLENKGMTAVVSGKGKVVSQSIVPGQSYKKGQTILLMLN